MAAVPDWVTYFSIGLSIAVFLMIAWINFGRPWRRSRRMRRPFDIHFKQGTRGDGPTTTELKVPAHSMVQLDFRMTPRIHHVQHELILMFDGDPDQKPLPKSVVNTFIKEGSARSQDPKTNANHYIDYDDCYHIKSPCRAHAGQYVCDRVFGADARAGALPPPLHGDDRGRRGPLAERSRAGCRGQGCVRSHLATASDLRRIALSLEGTIEAPHFDRSAFKVRCIYATLAADGNTANLMLTPDEQQLKCLTAPEIFAPVPNAWGRNGATTMTLAKIGRVELRAALETAWKHAVAAKPKSRCGKSG